MEGQSAIPFVRDRKKEWLELHDAEVRAKAFDEFINQMEAEVESSAKFIREYDDSIAQKAYYSGLCHALKIAEQLKEGGKHE